MAGGLSKNDPYRGMESGEDSIRPNLRLDGVSHKDGKKLDKNGVDNREIVEEAASELGAAERLATDNKTKQNIDDLGGVKDLETRAGGFYSGSGRLGGKGSKSKKGDKKKKRGWLRKGGPMGLIVGLILGVGGLMSGVQNLMPVAIEELIIEKFNSVGVSSTMASDAWLDVQLNQGVRLANITNNDTENLFAFSEYQVQQFESQGIRVVDSVGEGRITRLTALLYQKGGMWVPVVGSDVLKYNGYTETDLIEAIKLASGLNNIGTPISAKEALADSSFKNPYTTASKTWRGGASGWFDNIMADITQTKLSITRNRWARWVAKSMKSIEGGLSNEFKKIAKSANLENTSDGGMFKSEEIENEDGEVIDTKQIDDVEVEEGDAVLDTVNTKDTSVTSAGGTVEGISKVLNSKAIKAASAIGEYGCALLEGLVSIYTTVSAYQSLQFLNLISGFLEAVDKVKAGDGSNSPIHEYSTNLTTKADTRGDNDEVVAKDKTAMEAAGMSWLFGKDSTISANDPSVRNVNFETIMSNMSALTSNISLTASVYEKCGYVKAGVAAVDLATTIISFIPIAGQVVKGVQLTVKAGVKIAVKAAVQVALYAVIPIVAKNLAKMMIQDAATEWFGEDLGNAIISGANKYAGGNGTSGGQSPGSSAKVAEYLGVRDTVIAEEAEYQRAIRSPFDITSKYTFLGNLAYSVIPLAYSGGLMANIGSISSLVSSSMVAMSPTVDAIDKQSVLNSTGTCDLLGSTGAIGDAFCNPYIITDTSTMDTSPLAVNDIVHNIQNDSVVAANNVYENVGSGNFNSDGSINKDSNLAKYITYCGQRTSQYGIKDATIAEQLTGSNTTASKIIGVVPGLNNLQDIYQGLADEANLSWSNGSGCVASDENDHWDEYKWYQRYAENQRLLENMNPGYVSEVTAYLNDYYEENPLDQSLEGTLARFTGMSKESVEDTFALIEYFDFLDNYHPEERYAFGDHGLDNNEELKFDNENEVADNLWVILINQISYADVRNRSFAV